jgi:hypothetical protein
MQRIACMIAGLAVAGGLLRFEKFCVSADGGPPVIERRILFPGQREHEWPASVTHATAKHLDFSSEVSAVYGLWNLSSSMGSQLSGSTSCCCGSLTALPAPDEDTPAPAPVAPEVR